MDEEDIKITLRCREGKVVEVPKKVLMLSPVFRNMFAIGTPGKVSSVDSGERSGEPSHIEMDSHNEVRLDEDAKDMDLLFALLGRSTVKLSDYRIAIDRFKSLADKYDVTIATPLLAEQLWSQLSDGSLSAGSAFPIAVELEHLGMARCAVDLMNWKCAPATWEWKYVDQIGLRTWYILVRASQGPGILDEESGRPDWTKIARRLAFPPSQYSAELLGRFLELTENGWISQVGNKQDGNLNRLDLLARRSRLILHDCTYASVSTGKKNMGKEEYKVGLSRMNARGYRVE